MNLSRKSWNILLLGSAIGGILGIVIGLVVFGWWLWPVDWIDSAPDSLRVEYKELYLRSAIDSFTLNQDLNTANRVVELLGLDTLSILERIQTNPGRQDPDSIDLFISIAKGYDLEDIASAMATRAASPDLITAGNPSAALQETPFPNGSSSPSMMEIPLSQSKGRIVAFLISSDSFNAENAGIETLSKLVGLGLRDDIAVQTFSDQDKFLAALKDPYVLGALYGGKGNSPGSLRALNAFATGGGRVLFFYDGDWMQQNDLLQELFGVSLVAERVKYVKDELIYAPAMLPGWASGLNVGVAQAGQYHYINAYAVSNQELDQTGYLLSDESSKERLLYLSNMPGPVAFFPRPYIFERLANEYQYFFDDANIDLFDNQQAAQRMLKFLLED